MVENHRSGTFCVTTYWTTLNHDYCIEITEHSGMRGQESMVASKVARFGTACMLSSVRDEEYDPGSSLM